MSLFSDVLSNVHSYILNSLPSSFTVYILTSSSIFKYLSLSIKFITFLKRLQGRKVQLGPGKQTAKTWFGLEKCQIIEDNFYLPFFLLIILWTLPRDSGEGIWSPLREQKSLVVFVPCSCSVFLPVCLDEVWSTGGFPGFSVQVCTLCWSVLTCLP
jgi:hypothetical protein